MKIKFLILNLVLCFFCQSTISQNTLIDSLIISNHKVMSFDQGKFSGVGWENIVIEINSSTHILIGEDHFTNEIPAFTKALFDSAEFKNFYIEIDPYTTAIMEHSIKSSSTDELQKFNTRYRDLFSFYALKAEYDLLQYAVKSGIKLLGSDQIVMFSDRVIFNDLKNKSLNAEAKQHYKFMAEQSKIHLESFLKDPQNNVMYMMTPDFSKSLEKLSSLNLSDFEHQIIKDMQLSKDIYLTQSHKTRVRLIMNGVMNDLDNWKDNKTLFKYGANHLTRGEGFLSIYDIGNLVANITESDFKDTFHIMIVGENGFQGGPFRGFPPSKVDSENGFYLSYLKPFFNHTNNDNWHVFDLRPIRKSVLKKTLKIENLNLERAIRGYDVLIIIPTVTAAKHN